MALRAWWFLLLLVSRKLTTNALHRRVPDQRVT
jgi:hypothetical protein